MMASYHMHRHSYVSEHYVESESVCGGQTGARWLDVLYMISLSHTSLWYWWLRVLLMTANYILIYHVTTSSRPWTPNHEIEPTRNCASMLWQLMQVSYRRDCDAVISALTRRTDEYQRHDACQMMHTVVPLAAFDACSVTSGVEKCTSQQAGH